ncbi:MAG TPA: hypothetical protein P5084_10095 [Paludibacter sp.]|nr:hypothetical protein [Paludibacter sp.]
MNRFYIEYSAQALIDIDTLFKVISYNYKAPETAFRYINGLIRIINSLRNSADIYAVYTRKSLEKYGHNLKRINYKRMAIIFAVYNDMVYIHRIIPANTIVDL